MKIRHKFVAAAFALLVSTIIYQPSSVLGQGALTPPGSPGPTMLTLSQMEPRTPISVPVTISQPGSYYLATNITASAGNSAIVILANNVKLDLNGFTVYSAVSASSSTAIFVGPIDNVTNIIIVNGFVSGGVTNNGSGVFSGIGFDYGIYGSGFNFLVKNVAVSGCLYDGIHLSFSSSVVEDCTVSTAGGIGIAAESVSDSTAMNCGGQGIYAYTVNNCSGQANGIGVNAENANNSYGQAVGSVGLSAINSATGCAGSSSDNYGLEAATAINCYGSSSSYTGLQATTADTCYGTSTTGYGLDATIAEDCYGNSTLAGTGVSVDNANNCYGYSGTTGDGLYATDIATGCYGYSGGGIGIVAFIASVCHGETSSGTALSVTHNINSF